jgi:hydroxyacylglutathione hydrolase
MERAMKQIQPDLWETAVDSPFPGLTTHAYLLTREDGNVLFYNTSALQELDRMAALGGVRYQFLSHVDELGESIHVIRQRFETRLGGHVREQAEFARVRPADVVFEAREVHLGNIEVIPTPGHTSGSTCFLVSSPYGKRYLFTGDTLYLSDGRRWKAGFLSGISDRDALIESLGVLRTLAPDVVLGSAFAGPDGFQEMRPERWAGRVDEALAGLGEPVAR